jgi:hypothetical protein
MTPTIRSKLQKRLLRGRKFDVLVGLFGRQVLFLAPEVSVSRLAVLKLSDLENFATGSLERIKVQEIKEQLNLGQPSRRAYDVPGR